MMIAVVYTLLLSFGSEPSRVYRIVALVSDAVNLTSVPFLRTELSCEAFRDKECKIPVVKLIDILWLYLLP